MGFRQQIRAGFLIRTRFRRGKKRKRDATGAAFRSGARV